MSAQSGRIPAAEPAPWLHTLVYVVALVWHCRCVRDGLAGMSPDGERIIIVQTKVARPDCPAGIETGATSVHHSYCHPDYNTTMTTTTATTTSLDVTYVTPLVLTPFLRNQQALQEPWAAAWSLLTRAGRLSRII